MSKSGGTSYIEGVKQLVNFVKENAPGLTQCPYPCKHCKNSKGHIDLDKISLHLLKNGMYQSYVVWKHHGERTRSNKNYTAVTNPIEELNFPRLEDLIDDVYNVHTKVAEHVPDDASVRNEDDEGDDSIVDLDMQESKQYKKFKDMASEPLYPGFPQGKATLFTIIELQNLKTRYGWTGTSVIALLEWLKDLFTENCNLPKNYPKMKNIIKDLGMECETIHACRNGCILYRKEYEHLHVCPKCEVSQYKLVFGNDTKKKKEYLERTCKVCEIFSFNS